MADVSPLLPSYPKGREEGSMRFQGSGNVGKLVAHDPSNALWQSQLATSYGVEAIGLLGQGQSDAALTSFRKACAIQEKLVAEARVIRKD